MSIGVSTDEEIREGHEAPRVAGRASASPAEPVHSWSMEAPFKILEHPADIGFQAWGRTQAELFENAALALFSLSCELATVQESESRTVEVSASGLEDLLYAWLAELLAIAEGERVVFRRAAVSLVDAERIRATVYGEPLDRSRHRSGTHIKAITFHQLYVREIPDGWSAQVFVDL